MQAINLLSFKQDKKLCIVNNETMHILFTTSNKTTALEMLNHTLTTGDNYAMRGYVIQVFNTVCKAIKLANKTDLH